ncbi:MAG: hypothetical protein WDZ59_02375 [Pirellulales bacterium]
MVWLPRLLLMLAVSLACSGAPALAWQEELVSRRAASDAQRDASPEAPVVNEADIAQTTLRRWARFDPENFRARLLHEREPARSKALEDLHGVFADHPDVPELLIEAVQHAIDTGSVGDSTVAMVRLLASVERAQVRAALLRWLELQEVDKPATALSVAILAGLREFEDAASAQAAMRLLEASDFRLVMLSADILGQFPSPETTVALVALAERPEFMQSHGFRASALQAISRQDSSEAVDFLVRSLPRLDGQLKLAVVDHLTRISGQPIGGNALGWAKWWSANRASYNYPASQHPTPQRYAWDYPVPSFYAHGVYAKRVVFVVDISSTMRELVSPLETRLDRAKKELVRAIGGLPPDAAFNIVAFDREVQPWNPFSVPAVPENKQKAARAVLVMQNGRGTNIFDSLVAAIGSDPKLEAIYLLSDGLPTAGRVSDKSEIVRIITEENLFRRISIHTIAVGRNSQLLQRLAELNAGGYRTSQ